MIRVVIALSHDRTPPQGNPAYWLNSFLKDQLGQQFSDYAERKSGLPEMLTKNGRAVSLECNGFTDAVDQNRHDKTANPLGLGSGPGSLRFRGAIKAASVSAVHLDLTHLCLRNGKYLGRCSRYARSATLEGCGGSRLPRAGKSELHDHRADAARLTCSDSPIGLLNTVAIVHVCKYKGGCVLPYLQLERK